MRPRRSPVRHLQQDSGSKNWSASANTDLARPGTFDIDAKIAPSNAPSRRTPRTMSCNSSCRSASARADPCTADLLNHRGGKGAGIQTSIDGLRSSPSARSTTPGSSPYWTQDGKTWPTCAGQDTATGVQGRHPAKRLQRADVVGRYVGLLRPVIAHVAAGRRTHARQVRRGAGSAARVPARASGLYERTRWGQADAAPSQHPGASARV